MTRRARRYRAGIRWADSLIAAAGSRSSADPLVVNMPPRRTAIARAAYARIQEWQRRENLARSNITVQIPSPWSREVRLCRSGYTRSKPMNLDHIVRPAHVAWRRRT